MPSLTVTPSAAARRLKHSNASGLLAGLDFRQIARPNQGHDAGLSLAAIFCVHRNFAVGDIFVACPDWIF
jgi:hypothetical protein